MRAFGRRRLVQDTKLAELSKDELVALRGLRQQAADIWAKRGLNWDGNLEERLLNLIKRCPANTLLLLEMGEKRYELRKV